MKVLPVVHVLAVVAAALEGRPEPLEVAGVVRAARLSGQHPDPLSRQDVRGDPVGAHAQSGEARGWWVWNAERR